MSNQNNVSKAVLSSSIQDEKGDDLTALRAASKIQEMVNTNLALASQELHQNRIKSLRKELEYLKETEWRYEPIDKYIGQQY